MHNIVSTPLFLLTATAFLLGQTKPALAEQVSLPMVSPPAFAPSATVPSTLHPSSVQSLLSPFVSAFEPPDEGAPRETVSAGHRNEGRCSADSVAMRSLMPEANYGLTASARPVFWMEMPDTRAQAAELVLLTEQGTEHARAQLPIPVATEQGLVRFQLPETAAALTSDQNYQWTLSILCDGYLRPSDPFFSGWIKRVNYSPEMTQALTNAPETAQATILQEAGYWYDMLSLILENQKTFNSVGTL